MTNIAQPTWVADLEANGLLGMDPGQPMADTIWMFVAVDFKEKKILAYIKDDILNCDMTGEEVRKYIEDYEIASHTKKKLKSVGVKGLKAVARPLSDLKEDIDAIVHRGGSIAGHNFIKYDCVVLKKILGIDLPWTHVQDTLIYSQLLDPDRRLHGRPGHGLANWGEYFGVPKPEHEDWDNFSLDMAHRCIEDVLINVLVWDHLRVEFADPDEARAGVDWTDAITLEHEVAEIIVESELRGFHFNSKSAKKSVKRMIKHLKKLDKEIGFDKVLLCHKHGTALTPKDWPTRIKPIVDINPKEWGHFWNQFDHDLSEEDVAARRGYGVPIKNLYTKAGGAGCYSANIRAHWDHESIPEAMHGKTLKPYCPIDMPHIVGPFTKVKMEPVNPDSNPQLIRMLMSRGWEPMEFTEKGSPKITEDSIEAFAKQYPEYANLRDRIITKARISNMENQANDDKGLLNLVREDGTIPSINNTLGAATHRSKHKKVVNVPSVGSRWGGLFRKAFIAPDCPGAGEFTYKAPKLDKQGNVKTREVEIDGKLKKVPIYKEKTLKDSMVLIGCDAQALEMRILGALLEDPALIKEIVEGDIHMVFHATVDDLSSSRGNTKGLEYACISMDTEILSDSGWKSYKELEVGELVLTYNHRDGVQEWKPVLEKMYYDSSPIIHLNQTGWEAKVTPNHRWYCQVRSQAGDKSKRADFKTVLQTDQLIKDCKLLVNAPLRENRLISSEDILSDKKYGEPGNWVKRVLGMTELQRENFLAGFLIADGWQNKAGNWYWGQKQGELQEAALLASYLSHSGRIGVSSSIEKGITRVTGSLLAKPHITGQNLRQDYVGEEPVWCIRTENESFVMRYNNTITITGNSLYGAGPPKLGSLCDIGRDIIGETELRKAKWFKTADGYWTDNYRKSKDMPPVGFKIAQDAELGKIVSQRFSEGLPALKQLVDRLRRFVKDHGFLIGIDGRRFKSRKQHAALNLKIQSTGAIIMKRALVLAYNRCKKEGLPFELVCFYHDEFEVYAMPEDAYMIGEILEWSIREAGEFYNLQCPMDAEAAYGRTWADVH